MKYYPKLNALASRLNSPLCVNKFSRVLLACVLGVSATFLTTTAHAQEKITIAVPNWDAGVAVGHVIKAVIEGPLGGSADIIDGLGDYPIIGEALSRGDGSLDVFPDLWMPGAHTVWDSYIDGEKSVRANSRPYAGREGIYVPHYMTNTVRSLQDLQSPSVAQMFDSDGNGKGEYWAGDVEWNITKITQVKFKTHGLDKLWEPVLSTNATFLARLKAGYATQKPLLFSSWTPQWVHAAYDLVPVEEPAWVDGCNSLKLDAKDWLAASTMNCAQRESKVYVVYSKSLEQRAPVVAKFLSQIYFNPDDINGWVLEIAREKRDPQEVVTEWMEANGAIVEEWIQ